MLSTNAKLVAVTSKVIRVFYPHKPKSREGKVAAYGIHIAM